MAVDFPHELDIPQLYREHAAFVGRVIARLSGHGPHVDDLLQETFLVAFRKRREFRFEAAESTWLYRIAANLCANHNRSKRRMSFFKARLAEEPFPYEVSAETNVQTRQHAAMVHKALETLSFEQREVLVLFEFENLEGPQIAQTLGIPLGTVWTRLKKAREKFTDALRRQMKKEGIS